MSIEKMSAVLHHSEASGSTKLVLIGIANHDGDGGAWCSVETLAKYANIERRQVQKILRDLEESGEIVTIHREGITNRYTVEVSCPPNCDRSTNHKITEGGVLEDTGGGCPPRHGGGVLQDTGGVSYRTPEPYNNQTITKNDVSQFFDRYPRIGGPQKSVTELLNSLDEQDYQDLIEYLGYMRFHDLWPNEVKYIPYAEKWLTRYEWREWAKERRQRRERMEAQRQALLDEKPPVIPKCIEHDTYFRKCAPCRAKIDAGIDFEQVVRQTTGEEKK